jgi:thiol-disulfide isomerase/thioredoxin
MRIFTLIFSLSFFTGYAQTLWRLELPSPGGLLPVHISLEANNAYIVNADEKLAFDEVKRIKDTVIMKMDLYDLEIKLLPSKRSGIFGKRGADKIYRTAVFRASPNEPKRFIGPSPTQELASKYEIQFYNPHTQETSPGIGVFSVKGNEVTGSFLSTTGDHRYLKGNILGDSLFLSTLGSTATLYKAKIEGNKLVGGTSFSPFTAGNHFSGQENEEYQLPDADKLTYLKEGVSHFDFTFTDVKGKKVSLTDPEYKGKVTVVQLLGTWCPNCMDETRFLLEYRKKHPDVEVIGLAFERSADPSFAVPKIERFIQRYNVNYTVLLAGSIEEAPAKLPQLNHVMAFPTSIVVDKKGNVRKIHTGFSGPGTGKFYEEYVKEFSALMDVLRGEE